MWANTLNAVGLEIEQAAAVGNDRNSYWLDLTGMRSSVFSNRLTPGAAYSAKNSLRTAAAKLRIDVVEGEDDIDRSWRVEPRRDRAEVDQVEAEEAPGKCEIVAQEIEPAEQLIVVRDQGLVLPRSRSAGSCRARRARRPDRRTRRARENRRRGNARKVARKARRRPFPGRADGNAAPSPGMTKIAIPGLSCASLSAGSSSGSWRRAR